MSFPIFTEEDLPFIGKLIQMNQETQLQKRVTAKVTKNLGEKIEVLEHKCTQLVFLNMEQRIKLLEIENAKLKEESTSIKNNPPPSNAIHHQRLLDLMTEKLLSLEKQLSEKDALHKEELRIKIEEIRNHTKHEIECANLQIDETQNKSKLEIDDLNSKLKKERECASSLKSLISKIDIEIEEKTLAFKTTLNSTERIMQDKDREIVSLNKRLEEQRKNNNNLQILLRDLRKKSDSTSLLLSELKTQIQEKSNVIEQMKKDLRTEKPPSPPVSKKTSPKSKNKKKKDESITLDIDTYVLLERQVKTFEERDIIAQEQIEILKKMISGYKNDADYLISRYVKDPRELDDLPGRRSAGVIIERVWEMDFGFIFIIV